MAAVNPAAVRAEIGSSCRDRDRPELSGVGASSRITCAFVPPTPSALIAARRGFGPAGQRECGIDVEGTAGEVDVAVRLTEVQSRRDLRMFEREDGLDQSGNPGGRV